ncbi:hypothetical protein bcgnr5378_05630 [Bacillus cereus]|uniref:Uncharacterized protein n=1 Tax=Bacillus cereus TaxID=1396 RepID=A0A164LCC0_BACCE|nr:hypothetical protein [Bacillus cereus]KZD55660.1 hypothetical protein B4088_5405 [Bacillus cereus]
MQFLVLGNVESCMDLPYAKPRFVVLLQRVEQNILDKIIVEYSCPIFSLSNLETSLNNVIYYKYFVKSGLKFLHLDNTNTTIKQIPGSIGPVDILFCTKSPASDPDMIDYIINAQPLYVFYEEMDGRNQYCKIDNTNIIGVHRCFMYHQ